MCERYKACAILGHRKIEVTDKLGREIFDTVCDLVENKGVKSFLFGSRSEFDTLCYKIVSNLRKRYELELVVYTCKHETFIDNREKEELEKAFKVCGIKANLNVFDREVEYSSKYVSGKSSYLQRNYAMIDDCDYCLFYYNKEYKPTNVKGEITNSGTALAYNYAQKRSKNIINLYEFNN